MTARSGDAPQRVHADREGDARPGVAQTDHVGDDMAASPALVLLPATPTAWPADRRELAAALDAGCLEVLYQPVVATCTGEIIAVEALARLRDPITGALLPPAAFLPLAERCGLVGRLDALVAAQAIEAGARLRTLRPGRPFSVAVNASPAGLDEGLPDRLAALCNGAGLPYDALVVEVTETALSDPDRDARVLQGLAALGVNVTLDDFGTGYSSLQHLLRFPVLGIKIDRSFTSRLGEPGLPGAVAAAVVRLGLDLGLHVIAEGVETAEQRAALAALDCPWAQGYLFSRPAPEHEIAALLLGAEPAPDSEAAGQADVAPTGGAPGPSLVQAPVSAASNR